LAVEVTVELKFEESEEKRRQKSKSYASLYSKFNLKDLFIINKIG